MVDSSVQGSAVGIADGYSKEKMVKVIAAIKPL